MGLPSSTPDAEPEWQQPVPARALIAATPPLKGVQSKVVPTFFQAAPEALTSTLPACSFTISFSQPNKDGLHAIDVAAFQPNLYHNQDVFDFAPTCNVSFGWWEVVQVQSGLVRGTGLSCARTWPAADCEMPHVMPVPDCMGKQYTDQGTAQACTEARSLCEQDPTCVGVTGNGNGCFEMVCSSVVGATGHCVSFLQGGSRPSMSVGIKQGTTAGACERSICLRDGALSKAPTFSSLGYLTRGLNLVSGDVVPSLMAGNIFAWYWNETQTAPDPPMQYVPDQLSVTSGAECTSYEESSQVTQSTSTSSMKSQENSWGIKMDLGGAADTFGTWTDINPNKTKEFKGASLQFGRSSESKENQDYTSRGMSKHFNVRVRGNRLRIRRNPHKPVVFDPVFYDMLTALSDQSTQSEIFRFIQQFGLGVLSDVHICATFSNTAYFYDNASTAAISNYTKQVKTGGITLPFLDVNSTKTSQTLNIVDTSLGLSGQWSTSNSLGSLSIGSGACLQGARDIFSGDPRAYQV